MFVTSFLIYEWNFLFYEFSLDFVIFLYHRCTALESELFLAFIKFCSSLYFSRFLEKIIEIGLADLTFYC